MSTVFILTVFGVGCVIGALVVATIAGVDTPRKGQQ